MATPTWYPITFVTLSWQTQTVYIRFFVAPSKQTVTWYMYLRFFGALPWQTQTWYPITFVALS